MTHKGLDERPEVSDLTDDELLTRVTEACRRLQEAQVERDALIVDALARRLDHGRIGAAAGLARRTLFQVSDRVWRQRHAGGDD